MNKPKIFVTGKLPSTVEQEIASCFDAVLKKDDAIYSNEEIIKLSNDADGLIATINNKFDKNMINALSSKIKIISSFSVGYEHIDVKSANNRGIVVTNTPDVLTDATADIAMLLLLGAARRAVEGEKMVRTGQWFGWRSSQLMGLSLNNKRLGIVGMGRIGQAVAKRAMAFGMEIHYHSRSRLEKDVAKGFIWHETLESLLRVSQFLSLHCPLLPETRKLVNEKNISFLPDNAVIINTSRGGVVDDDALIQALKSKKLFAAGLDVYDNEPYLNEEYKKLDNCFLLPHLGSATIETRNKMGFLVIDNLKAFFGKEKLLSEVIL